MKTLLSYVFATAILAIFFYLFFLAGMTTSSTQRVVEEKTPMQKEHERTSKNINLLVKELAVDLCKVDPNQEYFVVDVNGQGIECGEQK